MKYRPFHVIAALLLCCQAIAVADQTNALTSEEKSAGWKLLFDGKTLEGWRGCARADLPGHGWSVEDGCLKTGGKSGRQGSGGGDLVTLQTFTDFDLKFDWRISPAGNSGVKYFVREGAMQKNPAPDARGKSGLGHEYQILDDEKDADAKNGPSHQAGALYALIAPNSAKHLNPVGEFNSSRILVRGNHVEHWLNGAKIVEYECGSPELLELVAKSKFKSIPDFGKKMPTVILLQDHGDTAWFRNLKILELPAGK